MTEVRSLAAAAAALAAAAAAGCGFGPGEASEGRAVLTVTRDYGSVEMLEAAVDDPPSSETVMRLLDGEAEIETRYGGGFVQSIDGVEGGSEGGRRHDWFFYVNGIESPVGAAEVEVRGGDRIWWDHRDWTDAMRVPAVVGSWPEPFLGGFEGRRYPARVRCLGERPTCADVSGTLQDVGASVKGGARPPIRVLVGPWAAVGDDRVAARIEDGPSASGVFADFENGSTGLELVALDEEADEVRRFGGGAGLVAATGLGGGPPTWVVTGTDGAGTERAAALLDARELRDRYAVAALPGGTAQPLPVIQGAG